MIFDELNFGEHFKDVFGTQYVKLNLNPCYNQQLPCYLNEEGNRTFVNAVNYNGLMVYIPFNEPCERIFNQTLDNVNVSDIISTDLNISPNENKNNENTTIMKTNTSTVAAAQYTLKQAVTEAVNTLKTNGKFSAHDVTSAIREAVNEGEYSLPGLENPDTTSEFKYLVKHDDVKEVLNLLANDGTLQNLGLTNIDYSGAYRVYEFATSTDTATDVADGDAGDSGDDDAVASDSPVATRIKNYLDKVGSATLKQVQSMLKTNGVTCKDLATIVDELGYTVTPGTEGCYSTYTVEA